MCVCVRRKNFETLSNMSAFSRFEKEGQKKRAVRTLPIRNDIDDNDKNNNDEDDDNSNSVENRHLSTGK